MLMILSENPNALAQMLAGQTELCVQYHYMALPSVQTTIWDKGTMLYIAAGRALQDLKV